MAYLCVVTLVMWCAGGLSSDGDLLVNFSKSFPDLLTGSRISWLGWQPAYNDVPCAWEGIQCHDDLMSISLPRRVMPNLPQLSNAWDQQAVLQLLPGACGASSSKLASRTSL